MMATLPLIILLVLFVIGFPIGFALMLCVVPYFALAAGIPMDVISADFYKTLTCNADTEVQHKNAG